MLSFWEKESLLAYDVIIIGSGIVGLSAAIELKERQPQLRVLVLERGILPTGASTKNAGFACFGSLTEILDDLNNMSEAEVLALVQMRWQGLQLLRNRIGDERMDFHLRGSYELIRKAEENCLHEMKRINALLQPMFGEDVFHLCDERISEFGFSVRHTPHLVQNIFEGQLHTGKMMRTLIDIAMAKGVEIKTGCEVLHYEENENEVRVYVQHTQLHEELAFTCAQLVLCTNAFTTPLFPSLDLQPGRGQVLITKPIEGLKIDGVYHYHKGYYYFRNVGNRLLFGGARHTDFAGERSTEFSYNESIREHLSHQLREVILPHTAFEIDDWWTGIMAFGKTKQPIVQRHSARITLGVRMGGMGVAIGSKVGEELAAIVACSSKTADAIVL